jgi:D-aminoacyl-tRNA deacylase
MRALVQRVSFAKVEIEAEIAGEIGQGLLVLLAVTSTDTQKDIDWIVKKVTQLRVFTDENDKMNLSAQDIKGELLLVSQFTLYADCAKGNRPSYTRSATPDVAIPMYNQTVEAFRAAFLGKIATGVFGADMKITLLNDGPVTIMMDSQQPSI